MVKFDRIFVTLWYQKLTSATRTQTCFPKHGGRRRRRVGERRRTAGRYCSLLIHRFELVCPAVASIPSNRRSGILSANVATSAVQNQEAVALYDEAQQAMAQDNYDVARRKLQQAHQTAPQVTSHQAGVITVNWLRSPTFQTSSGEGYYYRT